MAPKSSQRTSLGSSQPQPFEAAVTKLCNAIDNAKGKKGEIKYVTCSPSHQCLLTLYRAQNIVTRLKEFLKDYREARKVLGSDYISLVAGCLENDGDNVCSRLEPAIFCTVVELVLQTEPCIDGERSLFLLAVSNLPPLQASIAMLIIQKSIFNDIQDPESEKAVVSRKNKIGRGCRQQLLGYFLNERTAATMRRWVSNHDDSLGALLIHSKAGVLCVQLFQGCEDNCQWLAMGPEDFRSVTILWLLLGVIR
jgi:hypothetical protein